MFHIDPNKAYPKETTSKVIIRFQDCDPLQHLNNAKYFDYFFNARDDQVAKLYGVRLSDIFKAYQQVWVVYTQQISYIYECMNFMIKLLITALAVVISSYLLPGVEVDSFLTAVILGAVLAVLNVTLKPLLIILTIPATIFTLGLFILVVNALIILVADWLVSGFRVDGFWWALGFSLILWLVNTILQDMGGAKKKQ